MIKNQILITNGVLHRVPAPIQNLIWYIVKLVKPNEKFHEFSFIALANGTETKQLLTHSISDIDYVQKYSFSCSNPINETVYIANELALLCYLQKNIK